MAMGSSFLMYLNSYFSILHDYIREMIIEMVQHFNSTCHLKYFRYDLIMSPKRMKVRMLA